MRYFVIFVFDVRFFSIIGVINNFIRVTNLNGGITKCLET